MPEAEWSANFSCDSLADFLKHLPGSLRGFLAQKEIDSIVAIISTMQINDERQTTVKARFQSREVYLKVRIFLDDHNSPDVYFTGSAGIISAIKKAFNQFMWVEDQTHDCTLNFISSLPFKDKRIIKKLLDAITAASPEFIPERFGDHEPPKEIFDVNNIDRAVTLWKSFTFWKNRTYGTSGYTGFEGQTYDEKYHANVTLHCRSNRVPTDTLISLLLDLSILLKAEFSYCFIANKQEWQRDYYLAHYDQLYPMSLGVTTHDLRNGLPSLGWCTIFGPSYIQLFGRQRLLSCPAYKVSEINHDAIFIQLTERLHTVKSNFDLFRSRREKAKTHLGGKVFTGWVPTLNINAKCLNSLLVTDARSSP
jgi:hypothetical protein